MLNKTMSHSNLWIPVCLGNTVCMHTCKHTHMYAHTRNACTHTCTHSLHIHKAGRHAGRQVGLQLLPACPHTAVHSGVNFPL